MVTACWRFAPSFTVAPRDDAGATDLGKRRDRAINEATNALAQAAEHLEGFFAMLRSELADSFSMPIRHGVFSHFKKEEDTAMKSGKLDEELARMSKLADHLEGGALMLFNESFAATNEREGSEICRQITKALIENGVEVFSVTHLYTYAAAFLGDGQTQFLRAQRLDSGKRTFKVVPGEPLQTAFGEDLYKKIFG